jgi:hypothetical protein
VDEGSGRRRDQCQLVGSRQRGGPAHPDVDSVNPGFDGVADRRIDPGPCYTSPAFEPGDVTYDWTRPEDRTFAARASERRIGESFQTTIALQTDPLLADVKRGFFLVYINSFNEWHEGHQFEPMKDLEELTAGERAAGYHNPADGGYRLAALRNLLANVLDPR